MNPPITVRDDLTVAVGPSVVAHLRTDEALDLAAELARRAFRRIAAEEGAAAVLDGDHHEQAQ